jgi:hypothetical protein
MPTSTAPSSTRRSRAPPAEKQMLVDLLYRSGAIRDALDEAIRIAGDDARTADAVAAAVQELEIIAAGIMKLLERGR